MKALVVAGMLLAMLGTPVQAEDRVTEDLLAERDSDTMLASALGEILVVTLGGETLGDVTDVVLSRDGRIIALIVGVGGFLGVAEKPVAITWKHLKVRDREDGEGFEFVCDLDRAVLDNAVAYRERDD